MEAQYTVNSIVFIVSLIVPGVIFKRFYFQGQFTKQFGAGLFADRLITSIFWGIFVQIITFLFYSRIFGFTYTSIKQVIDKAYIEISKNLLPDFTYVQLSHILGYLVFLLFMSGALGTFLHSLIRVFKIDVFFKVLRFSNEWNYYFKGEILSTSEFKGGKKGKVLSTNIDLLIEDGTEKNKMVSGYLTQYTLSSKTGELETIYLTNAKRYSKSENKFKEIPGDCFIVPFNKVIDMNLIYNTIKVASNEKKQLTYNLILNIGFWASYFYLSTHGF